MLEIVGLIEMLDQSEIKGTLTHRVIIYVYVTMSLRKHKENLYGKGSFLQN